MNNIELEKKILINKKENKSYKKSEIDKQMSVIKLHFEDAKKLVKEGKKQEELSDALYNSLTDFIYQIQRPTLNEFYRMRTVEYLLRNKIVLNEAIDRYLSNQTKTLDEAYKLVENLEDNIDLVIGEAIEVFEEIDYVKSEKFNDLRAKIETHTLTGDDKANFRKYIMQYLEELQGTKNKKIMGKMIKNPQAVANIYLKNIDKFFEVEYEDEIVISKEHGQITDMFTPELNLSEEDIDKIKDASKKSKNKDKYAGKYITGVKLKKFVQEPFMTTMNEENSILIYLHTFLNDIPKELLPKFYFITSLPGGKDVVKKMFKQIKVENRSLRSAMYDRIAAITLFLESGGELKEYNEKNNEILESAGVGLNILKISTDDLFKILMDLENSNLVPLESMIGIAAFYTNRLTKVAKEYTRTNFIFDREDILKKLEQNPDLEFEDLKLTSEKIKEQMALYDTLEGIIDKEFYSKIKKTLNNKKKTGYSTKQKRLLINVGEKYRAAYDELFGNFYLDMGNVSKNFMVVNKLYLLKDFAIKSLLYTAITSDDTNIINWGYIEDKVLEEKEKVLVAFDIKFLNMPIMFHMKRDDLESFLKNMTGSTKIRRYQLQDDMRDIRTDRRIRTLVCYPITAKQRKALASYHRENRIIKHIRLLQDPKMLNNMLKEDAKPKDIAE